MANVKKPVGIEEVVVTDRRKGDRRSKQAKNGHALPSGQERRFRPDRRRNIDPTTCERDYTPEELEFMRAMDEYKRTSGRPFPTWSEVLEVLRNLGYRKAEAYEHVTAG